MAKADAEESAREEQLDRMRTSAAIEFETPITNLKTINVRLALTNWPMTRKTGR